MLPRRCAISDRQRAGDLLAWVDRITAGERLIVQLRERDLDGRALVELARAMVAICRPRGCPLLVSDRVDIALAAGADGAQLPEHGLDVTEVRRLVGSTLLLGASRHDPAGVAAAAAAGADLILFGPVWPTPSKPDASGVGPDGLRAAVAAAGQVPLFALGGVDSDQRERAARAAGAWGSAGIRRYLVA